MYETDFSQEQIKNLVMGFFDVDGLLQVDRIFIRMVGYKAAYLLAKLIELRENIEDKLPTIQERLLAVSRNGQKALDAIGNGYNYYGFSHIMEDVGMPKKDQIKALKKLEDLNLISLSKKIDEDGTRFYKLNDAKIVEIRSGAPPAKPTSPFIRCGNDPALDLIDR